MRIAFTSVLICLSCFAFSQTHFYIANRDGDNILRYHMDGSFIEEFVSSGSGNLSRPQEVLFHPNDSLLLVTGFNNPNIKKYDAVTGDYLGNFSQGFNLDNPTKMLIGPDNLLYVSQWGSPSSKIVRFDLQGNFVDEWSEVDVPEGCGMAFDIAGNLYITTWSNGQNNGTAGFVRKFDPEGNDLGIVINTSVLQGPVGIWIDDVGEFYVVDWTLGRVSKFNINGGLIEQFITGMTRTEGNAFGPDGKYYLCDWQSNRINRYNIDGSFDTTLVNTGLNIPNSITFGPDGIVNSIRSINKETTITIYPNPVNEEHLFLEFTAEEASDSELTIYNIDGKIISRQTISVMFGENKHSLEIEALDSGLYYFNLTTNTNHFKGSFTKL